jgi:hypothetical protein
MTESEMPATYESDPFRILRAALSQLCEDAIYNETESDTAPSRPCPDYLAMLRDTSRAIIAARSVSDLARIDWIAGKAALGAESMDSAV